MTSNFSGSLSEQASFTFSWKEQILRIWIDHTQGHNKQFIDHKKITKTMCDYNSPTSEFPLPTDQHCM